ncbi:hypothetical protein FTV88_0916 [Heliorestis convoluta]|uniref:Uncharacterized protein n=1 Tax=Heliorestis convoluta TaxID=356322 RepID=A0A5Q2MX05_9FIRM|nr:hypothetical protein FTV88_0916 [Heliorestis convoluta]
MSTESNNQQKVLWAWASRFPQRDLGPQRISSLLAVTAWDQSRAEESVMTWPLYEVTPM